MSSLLDVRLGAQEPTIQHLPPDVHSLAAAEECIELADAYLICDGNPLAESQKITLRAALGERADGSWAASRVGDFGPRQGTGKNDKIAARELAGLVLFGEPLIIHTAHEFPTANESFLRLVSVFENWDDLRKLVARILYGNGTQSINLLSGQRILYKARTGGAGRGFSKAALVVYDEAQHLLRSQLAASAPAMLAYPNSQSWLAGSGGFTTSEPAWAMRRAAILGTGGRLAYTEMTAETIAVVNGRLVSSSPAPLDRDSWYRCMPGLGRWVFEEGMQALYDDLGPSDFAREGQCVWDPEPIAVGKSFLAVPWAGCKSDDESHGRVRYAVDIDTNAKGEEWCSVGCSDGEFAQDVTPIDAGPGTGWVVPTLEPMRDVLGELLIDPNGPARKLIEPLEQAGFTLRKLKTTEVSSAAMHFSDRTKAGLMRHIGQPRLDVAVEHVACRDVGDGAFKFSRTKSADDISPLNAVSFACWASQLDSESAYEDRGLVTL